MEGDGSHFIKEYQNASGFVGTPGYIAPEIISHKPYQGSDVDIFALGATLLVCRTMKYGFDNARNSDEDY